MTGVPLPEIIRVQKLSPAMAYSDDEYVQDVSSDEGDSHLRPRGGHIAARSANQNNRAAAWEVSRTWDDLPTNPDGTIRVEALEANKRKR